MKRSSVVLYCAVLGWVSSACGPGLESEASADRSDSTLVDRDHLSITVSGRAELFPEAARLQMTRGQPLPSLEGFSLTVEEPLLTGVSDADAVLGRGDVGTDGTFSVPGVSVKDIHLSLAATLEHDGFVRTSSVVFDTVYTRTRPSTDIVEAHAWALPNAFHDALTRAVGESWIRALTEDRARTLRASGFILGRIVDASGAPVRGARVALDRGDLVGRVYYPAVDFQSATQDATSDTGLFVYVHSGADTETFGMSVQGSRDYVLRNVGATAGMALVVTLTPGTQAP